MATVNPSSSGTGPTQQGCGLVNLLFPLAAVAGFFAAGQPVWRAGGWRGLFGGTLLGLLGAVAAVIAACLAVGVLGALLFLYLFLHERYAPGYRRPAHRKVLRIRTFLTLTVVVAFWLWLGRILSAAFDAPGKRWEALLMAVVLPGGLIVVFAEPWCGPMFQAHRPAPLPPQRDNLGLHLRGPWGELRRPRKPAAADGETDRTPPP